MSKNAIMALAVVAIVGTLVLTSPTRNVGAQESQDKVNSWPPIIQRLVERFGLDENEVNSFMEEEKVAREARMKESLDTTLATLVSDGKLTQEQATQLKAKLEELRNKKQDLMGKNPEESREEMMKLQEEFKAWLEENGIDLKDLGLKHLELFGGMKFKGDKKMWREDKFGSQPGENESRTENGTEVN